MGLVHIGGTVSEPMQEVMCVVTAVLQRWPAAGFAVPVPVWHANTIKLSRKLKLPNRRSMGLQASCCTHTSGLSRVHAC